MEELKSIKKISEAFAGRKNELYGQKDEGRKVFGLFCTFVPTELILAANAVPVGLCGGKEGTIPSAEEILPRNICPLIKSSFGFKKDKACPYIEASDVIIGETTCDGKKKMFEHLAEMTRLHIMQLPHFRDDRSAKLWLAEVEELKKLIEEETGNKITEEKLKEAIDKVNNVRKLFYKIYELRANNPSPINGKDSLKLFQLSYLLDINTIESVLEDLVEELEERVKKGEGYSGKRILIAGCPMVAGNTKIPELIEDTGAVVVGEESCTGTRQYENYVEGYTIEKLADRYFKIPCACKFSNEERIERIKELVKEQNADGVVYYTLQYCHTFNVEGALIEKELKKAGIPIIRVETDYSESDKEQLKTRIEAFVEMI
ncbi:double-cubane-cluster-containing anaerobic reductase [Methanococcus maripaludis]|uniref:2-hydroxyglutaryl-CoA dehydratase (Component D) related protein n=2 Tax=Methanococcus maripaludis TaxID=39152 RepID=Q6M0C5_METMP|nr:double-cubane-cluster-containing anaerobic reductase [Methanococcus maripaludis]MBA2851385.1 benzoyl-CoA reductase/2-hydroxyglutaryl-CoA dehydratase subunit BcrC/BadD/HgdB [Methanococcus maripaludis]MBM7410094.1 benzoyl-CoA reductase/2-hydroxyglutaryl-CoA dehydratase subunit BcrC/BadD/HgdB [Methanococcus maripaludis]MBP2219424.1 benzoyl-CoA reductase/2-hydroxyglutaryl-CoA dehydratase subunit BcrC/BadD/HgdB [Methanococcus maripaludis]CAF29902.1 2-hydroxyglutaryl-CoA dehydratase (Component D) 